MTKRVKRRIACLPNAVYFKPRGIPVCDLEVVELTLNELEAARLIDLEKVEQEEAAHKMGISRRTFWIDLQSARHKIMPKCGSQEFYRIHEVEKVVK